MSKNTAPGRAGDVVGLVFLAAAEPLVRQIVAGVNHAHVRRAQMVRQPGGVRQGISLEVNHELLDINS
jgi:hypothetical protein